MICVFKLYFPILCLLLFPILDQFCRADVQMIRHERSRVRHSSEKDHIRWGLKAFDNLTLDYDFDSNEQNDTNLDMGNNTYGGNLTDMPTQIEFGKFLDYGTNVYAKLNHRKLDKEALPSSQPPINNSATVLSTPTVARANITTITTAVKKKLGKKAIMANIRKNVDKGVEYLKAHANLTNVDMDTALDVVQKQLTTAVMPSSSSTSSAVSTQNNLRVPNDSKPVNQIDDDTMDSTIEEASDKNLNRVIASLSPSLLPPLVINEENLLDVQKSEKISVLDLKHQVEKTEDIVDEDSDTDEDDIEKIHNHRNRISAAATRDEENEEHRSSDNDKELEHLNDQERTENVQQRKHSTATGKINHNRHPQHHNERYNDKLDTEEDDDDEDSATNPPPPQLNKTEKILISQIEYSNHNNENSNQLDNISKIHHRRTPPPASTANAKDNDNGMIIINNNISSTVASMPATPPPSPGRIIENRENHSLLGLNDSPLSYRSDYQSAPAPLQFPPPSSPQEKNVPHKSEIEITNPSGLDSVDNSESSSSDINFDDTDNNNSNNDMSQSRNINFDYGDFVVINDEERRSSSASMSGNNDNEELLPADESDAAATDELDTLDIMEEEDLTKAFDDGDQIMPPSVYHMEDIDLMDLDETSRANRINLMKGRDVVTRFLQIVETQHLLGANCTAGTALNLGEGVVDRYAQDRFRVEAEVAVNRANMLTRIFKLTSPAVQASEHLLHASVLSMVEFDDDIFAAGNCFDWNQHPAKKGLFCPFAYRLPAPDQGASLAKDLAAEYHYLGNTSEWFFLARKNAEKVIAQNEQYIKSYHLYSNSTSREADEILSVKYEDGRWSKPYYDCGGGNIWMLTYTVPFFGYENGTYFFKGTSGIDIDLRRVDIDQCPQKKHTGASQPLNIFAGTDKCKQRTTECNAIPGLGFRRGSYRCSCRRGFYFPDTNSPLKFFNGSTLEEEYEKYMRKELTIYNTISAYECLPCAEGCDQCLDPSPCVAALNWPMRTSILVLACTIIGLLPPAVIFTFKYQRVKVVRAASPALLRVIALGAFLIYCTSVVMYPPPSIYTCTARVWLREIGFSLTYGALMLKTWRISVIFRVRSAKAVKITDASLLKRLGVLCCVVGAALLVRTIVAPPLVVVGRTKEDLKAFLCKTDWWDHTFTSMEVLFLAWGVRLCIMVRKAPSEFNESRFISMAIYNEFLLTCFLNVSMLFLQSPANPDLLYIIFFCHTQLTVTLLLALIFGSKVYMVFRGGGKPPDESMGMGMKSSGAKFICRSQARTMAHPSTATSSTAQLGGYAGTDLRLSELEAVEEIRSLCNQLQMLHDRVPPRGVAVVTITACLDLCKTTNPLTLKPPIVNKINDTKVLRVDKSTNTDTKTEFHSETTGGPPHLGGGGGCAQITITDEGDKNSNCTPCPVGQQPPPSPTTKTNASGKRTELNFDNLELECMCSSVEQCDIVSDQIVLGNNNKSNNFNKRFKISCKRGIHNYEITNRNLQNLIVEECNLKERTCSSNTIGGTPNNSLDNNSSSSILKCNCSFRNNHQSNVCDNIECSIRGGAVSHYQKVVSVSPTTSSSSSSACTQNQILTTPDVNISTSPSKANNIHHNDLDSIASNCCLNVSNKFETSPHNSSSLNKQLHLKLIKNLPAGQMQQSPLSSKSGLGGGGTVMLDSDDSKLDQVPPQAPPPPPVTSSSTAAAPPTSKRNKQNDTRLVLDLNDRSKYTKEVSV